MDLLRKASQAYHYQLSLEAVARVWRGGCIIRAAPAYFDAYRSARLPANLIQAQSDFFGASTYERIDEEGVFHTQWE